MVPKGNLSFKDPPMQPTKGRDEQQGRGVRYFVEMQAKWPKGFIQIQLLPE
jgi:hypothetical protein